MQGNTIPFQYDPFWKGKWCPAHSSDGTLKCCSCSRLNPRGQEWVTELDGRTVCLDCLSSLVRDTPDAQPLYDQVSYRHITVSKLAPCLPGVLPSFLGFVEQRLRRSSAVTCDHLRVVNFCQQPHSLHLLGIKLIATVTCVGSALGTGAGDVLHAVATHAGCTSFA